MDMTPLTNVLRSAKALVGSHGIMKYMRDYERRIFDREIDETTYSLRYEFCVDPQKSVYSSDNVSCSLNIYYDPGTDYDHEGGINRRFTRRVTMSYNSCEMTLSTLPVRENFIKALAMIAEMLETIMPPDIVIVVRTAEEVADRKALREEQQVAENVFREIGWDAIKGLRKGGRSRVVRLPSSYSEKHGAMPLSGAYRYEQVRRTTRRGHVREKANYLFKVFKTFTDEVNVKIFRVG